MRISGGELKGRVVRLPKETALRPTTERVREAVFSTLYSMGSIESRVVLDLYAGSGLLGIEALSRGATRAVFVENDKSLARQLELNLVELGLESRAQVVHAEVLPFVRARRGNSSAAAGVYGLVLVDPPYSEHPGNELLQALLDFNWVSAGATIAVEMGTGRGAPEIKENFIQEGGGAGVLSVQLIKSKQYGDTQMRYFRAA